MKNQTFEGKDRYKLCDHCLNNSNGPGVPCSLCKNRDEIHGREGVIRGLKEKGVIKESAKLRNIVNASPIVLFKDLCKVCNVPFYLSNKITTSEIGKDCLERKLNATEFEYELRKFLNSKEIEVIRPVLDKINYVYELEGIVYNSSIHASGTLLSDVDMPLPIDAETGDCHFSGHFAEELGYIKYDLLSLNNLDPISEIIGMDIDWNCLSDDREVMDWITNNDLQFVFQFGSSIVADMINNVPKDKIDTIALSEVSAINRPGCLKMHLNEKWVDTQNHNIKMKDEIDEEFNNVLKEINED